MKRPTFWEIVEAVLFAALVALIIWGYWHITDDCERRHGTLVRTMVGFECVALERR